VKANDLINQPKWHPYLLAAAVLLSRLPFIFDGYGHEEDSYGLVVNAMQMHDRGEYIASRFPGHPFQEYFYLLIWNQPAWVWNLLSTLFSVVAVNAFYHAMKRTGIGLPLQTSLMFAFTPMFFLAGTYTIDYAWSLAFVMLSFSSLVCRKYFWCGVMLALAVGCRITSAIFIVPWMMLLWQRLDFDQWRNYVLKIGIPFAVISILFYVPAYLQYGTGFFDYSDQFPYPPFTKIIYKATIGVFGLLGIAALLFAKVRWLTSKQKDAINPPQIFSPQRLTWVILVIVVLHIISYLRLPQKAGYMLAIVPFVMILLTMYSNLNTIRIVTMIFILSPFLLGMNITDELRGSGATGASIKFNISGQEISIDAARGPALAEQQKRRNKMEFVKRVSASFDSLKRTPILICGWWYNELVVEWMNDTILKNPPDYRLPGYNIFVNDSVHVQLEFYVPCKDMILEESYGRFKYYYLPEQDLYNDQMFGQSCTNSIAEPFPIR
jgi:hypothetical protein